MKTASMLAWGVLAIVVIILGVYALSSSAPTGTGLFGIGTSTPADGSGSPQGGANAGGPVTYYCKEGQFDATFSAHAVQLSLSDGRYFVLPQAESGSGIRYEGTINGKSEILAGKGDSASLTENGATLYSNCVAAHISDTDGVKTYVSQAGTFSFSYPNAFSVVGTEPGYSTSWAANATTSGLLLAAVQLPASVQPKTNFAGAQFTIGTSADPAAVATCLAPGNGATLIGTANINGLAFDKFSENDAGAGNIYATISYRIVRDSQCYALEYTIHSLQLGNFDPSQGVTAFDAASVDAQLRGIAASFKFLK